MPSARPTVIVQARMGSERLPGKVLTDLCGAPLLRWLLERVGESALIERVMVATTTDTDDDAVEALCAELGVQCFRGDPTDVLDRVAAAARDADADAVVRVSGDSPFLGPECVDAVIADFDRGGADLVENHRHPGWPVGTAAEVLTRDALERIAVEAGDPGDREHVTLYAYERGAGFRIRHVDPPEELRAPELRICVDTPEDLERARAVCGRLGPDRTFPLASIVALARRAPALLV